MRELNAERMARIEAWIYKAAVLLDKDFSDDPALGIVAAGMLNRMTMQIALEAMPDEATRAKLGAMAMEAIGEVFMRGTGDA